MSDAIKAEIKKLEDRRFQAMIDSDFDTLDKLLGDDLIYTHSTAQSDTRADYIALCKKGVFKYLKIERPIEHIQVYGDAVVVTGPRRMASRTSNRLPCGNVNITAAGRIRVRTASGVGSLAWMKLPGSTCRKPTRPSIGATMVAYPS